MTEQKLRCLLKAGENEQIEFKASFDKEAIDLGRFANETIIKDSLTARVDLFGNVNAALSFLRKHLNKEFIITGEAQRVERWDYPMDALREIVINMVVHRDYMNPSESTVKIFDDHIEFYNPSKLSGGLSIQNLLAGNYTSTIRNKQVAALFKEAGLIERYGSGIKRILESFANYGLRPPLFEELQDGFRVIVRQVTPQVLSLLQIIVEPGSRRALQEKLGLKDREHFRRVYLQPALKAGLIAMCNPDNPRAADQKYRITEQGQLSIRDKDE